VPNDTNGQVDVFVRDTGTGTTERVSVGPQNQQLAGARLDDISNDGRYVLFDAFTTSGCTGLALRDRQDGTTQCGIGLANAVLAGNAQFIAGTIGAAVSVLDRDTGTLDPIPLPTGEAFVSDVATSDDGRHVAFGTWKQPGIDECQAPPSPCPPPLRASNVYLSDRATGTTERLPLTLEGSLYAQHPAISSDGRFVAYEVYTPDEFNTLSPSLWLYDRQTRATEPISVGPGDAPGFGTRPDISADGRFVAFNGSGALDPDSPYCCDAVYVRDRTEARPTLVSTDASGTPADGQTFDVAIAHDARSVAFASTTANATSNDTNDRSDVSYARSRLRSSNR
jgi:Tol biopolymer transport system component